MDAKGKDVSSRKGYGKQLDLLRAGSLVFISSLVVLPEALQVWVSSNLNTQLSDLAGDSDTYPPGLLMGSGAAEMVIIITSMLTAIGVVFFNYNNPILTIGSSLISFTFGWYVFIVNAVSSPIFNFENNNAPPLEPLGGWATKFREEATFYMGYLVASMAICAIALGFQFFTNLNLYRIQTGSVDAADAKPSRIRLGYYSFLVILLGAGILTVAGWTRVQEGEGKLPRQVIYPPTFIVYPDVAVMSGLWVLLYGLVCAVASYLPSKELLLTVESLSVLLWLWAIFFHVMTQVASAGPGFSGPAIQIAGLFTAVCFAPAYFSRQIYIAKYLDGNANSITDSTHQESVNMGGRNSVTMPSKDVV